MSASSDDVGRLVREARDAIAFLEDLEVSDAVPAGHEAAFYLTLAGLKAAARRLEPEGAPRA